MRSHLPLFLAFAFVAACTTDDRAPRVTVVSATPDHIDPADDLVDDLSIRVDYEDDDGDLGGGIAEIHDCRDTALLTKLSIPAIASDDRIGSPIHGSLDLYLTDVGDQAAAALPGVCSDLGVGALGAGSTVFCVVLVDVAEHAGPGDCTASIAIAP